MPEGPADGHTFRFAVTSRGSYRVEDGPHFDADWGDPEWTLEVRAWSLNKALRKAAELPLTAWTMSSEIEIEES